MEGTRQYRMPRKLKLATRLDNKNRRPNKLRKQIFAPGQPPADERVMKLRYLQRLHTISIQQGSFSVRNVMPLLRSTTVDEPVSKNSVAM